MCLPKDYVSSQLPVDFSSLNSPRFASRSDQLQFAFFVSAIFDIRRQHGCTFAQYLRISKRKLIKTFPEPTGVHQADFAGVRIRSRSRRNVPVSSRHSTNARH